jgi:hypothetical protein
MSEGAPASPLSQRSDSGATRFSTRFLSCKPCACSRVTTSNRAITLSAVALDEQRRALRRICDRWHVSCSIAPGPYREKTETWLIARAAPHV